MRSTRGRLLLAGPHLHDPNFFRTVVLMLDHDENGALGVVLNRPSEFLVEDAIPPWLNFVSEPSVVFLGGPVAPETALAVGISPVFAPEPAGFSRLVGGVGLVDLEATPPAPSIQSVRIFAGYAGWGPGQLEAELHDDAWLILDAAPGDVATLAPALLWQTVLARQNGPIAMLAAYPDEPAWN